MEHTFSPSTREAEAGGFLSSRPAWSQSEFQDSQGYTEKPCLGKNKKQTNKQKKKEKRADQKDSIELGIRLVVVVLQEVKEKGRSTGIFHASPQDWTVSYQ